MRQKGRGLASPFSFIFFFLWRKWRMEEIAQAYMVSKMTMEVGRRKDEAQRLN